VRRECRAIASRHRPRAILRLDEVCSSGLRRYPAFVVVRTSNLTSGDSGPVAPDPRPILRLDDVGSSGLRRYPSFVVVRTFTLTSAGRAAHTPRGTPVGSTVSDGVLG